MYKRQQKTSEETVLLNKWFSDIVIDRGTEPLAPRDMIPMHDLVAPSNAGKDGSAGSDDSEENLGRPKGPLGADQQVEVKTTLTRGPMFSEIR